jgi:hypothetical protein
MPKPRAMVDYWKCRPEKCDEGICLAASACLNGVLSQEALLRTDDVLSWMK